MFLINIRLSKCVINALHAYKNIFYFNGDSDVVFICNETGFLNIDLNNIGLEDTNHDEDDPDIIILIKLLA